LLVRAQARPVRWHIVLRICWSTVRIHDVSF